MSGLFVGDRAPAIIGATASGQFYSLDAQAGRAAVMIAFGALDAQAARRLWDDLKPARILLQSKGVDVTPLAEPIATFAEAFTDDDEAKASIVYVSEASGLETARINGQPAGVFVDRGGRIIHISAIAVGSDLFEAYGKATPSLDSEPARGRTSAAPILILPNIMSHDFCAALIAHFEASPHRTGVIASVADGRPIAKVDESKKRRREIELTGDVDLHKEVVNILAMRCAPEIKKAFQVDIAHADRILIARYDDTGGYFKRHRDNAAPHTAFREFAISINLNTPDYEGGELMFPEYDDHRYSPPKGGAIIFSASLLHEAAPVTRGSRYVLLSFLSSNAALSRLGQAA